MHTCTYACTDSAFAYVIQLYMHLCFYALTSRVQNLCDVLQRNISDISVEIVFTFGIVETRPLFVEFNELFYVLVVPLDRS